MPMRNPVPIFVIALLFGLNSPSAIAAASDAQAASPDAGPSVLVRLTKLERGSLPRLVSAFGRVGPNPSAQQTIQAPLAAVVEEVYIKPGQEVAEGDPLIRLGPTPATVASYAQATSALHTAREAEQRTRSLLAQHLATAQQLADAQKAVSDAQSTLAALRAEGAARPQIVHAPAAAIVTAVSTSLGSIVTQGAALLELARPNGLILRAGLVPERANGVHPGDPATVTALGSMASVSGHVLLRGSMIDQQTGLVPVDIALPPGSLLPGQMAEAAITTGEVEGYVVPHAAVLVDDAGAPYLVQVTNGIARKIPIRVLLDGDGKDVVAGALDPTGSLVLEGNHQLTNGMRVRVSGFGKPADK